MKDKPPAVEIDPIMRALRARFSSHDWRLAIGALVADVHSRDSAFSQPPIDILVTAGVAVDAAAAIVEVLQRGQAISQATPEAPHGRIQ